MFIFAWWEILIGKRMLWVRSAAIVSSRRWPACPPPPPPSSPPLVVLIISSDAQAVSPCCFWRGGGASAVAFESQICKVVKEKLWKILFFIKFCRNVCWITTSLKRWGMLKGISDSLFSSHLQKLLCWSLLHSVRIYEASHKFNIQYQVWKLFQMIFIASFELIWNEEILMPLLTVK